jgi:hypothetical protein
MSVGIINAAPAIKPDITTLPAATKGGVGPGVIDQSGGIGQYGPVPGSVQPGSPGAVAVNSLAAMMPRDIDNPDAIIASLTAKLEKAGSAASDNQIKVSMRDRKTALESKAKKLDEAAKKLEQEKNAGFWGKIKLAFEALGLALTYALGAVLSATGVGAVLGGFLIAGAVIGTIMFANDIVKEATGLGIAGNIAKAIAPNDPAAWAKADMGFTIVCAAAALACSIGCLASAAGAATTLAALPAKVKAVCDTLKSIKDISGLATSVVTATGDAVAGGIKYDADHKEADRHDLLAAAKAIDAHIQSTVASIETAISSLVGNAHRSAQETDALSKTLRAKGDLMLQARFTA